jgi:hypothetical protein
VLNIKGKLIGVVWLLLGLPLVLGSGTAAGQQEVIERFTGSGSGRAGPFRADGPWMLTWRAGSAFPMLAEFAVHLYDARSDRFVGIAVSHTGVGSGQKVIAEPGQYRMVIIGRHVDWAIRIDEAPAELADFVRRRPDVTRVTLVPPRTGLARDVVDSIRTWRAEDDETLVLTTEEGATVRVRFYENVACPGLSETGNIFFVTSSEDRNLYNAILTEEGTRCYIGRIVSTR